jgi:uncharacterized membrane protein YcaP (DUF421 family)
MEIVVRATIVFWILWILLRATGKRELAEMTPFELIVLMVIGDLIQQGVTEEDMSLTGAALAISTIVLWALLLSYAAFRSRRLRRIVESRPAIIVAHGEIDHEMLKIERLTLEDLLDEARNAGLASIADVEWAVLEADGKFSFLRAQPAT